MLASLNKTAKASIIIKKVKSLTGLEPIKHQEL